MLLGIASSHSAMRSNTVSTLRLTSGDKVPVSALILYQNYLARPLGGFGVPGLPLFPLYTAGQVFLDDVVDFLHDHGVKPRRFVDRRVRETGLGGEIDIREFALKPGSRDDPLTEAVLLKQIYQVKDIFRHWLGFGCIERDDEFDGNVLPVKL